MEGRKHTGRCREAVDKVTSVPLLSSSFLRLFRLYFFLTPGVPHRVKMLTADIRRLMFRRKVKELVDKYDLDLIG